MRFADPTWAALFLEKADPPRAPAGSAASAWEIAIKARIGKLDGPAQAGSVNDYVVGQGFRALPISLEHAERAGRLAIQHRDPFDRMLVGQALAEDMLVASNEAVFDSAGVPSLVGRVSAATCGTA